MSSAATTIPHFRHDRGSRIAISVIEAAMSLPGARVDRSSYLRDQLSAHCPEPQVKCAINTSPAKAGVRGRTIESIARSAIRSHSRKAAGLSLMAGLPGGPIGLATIPADVAQFTWHAIVVAQKLAYLYGWPDLEHDGAPDEETENRMVLLLGSMMGVRQANTALKIISENLAMEVAVRVPRQTLTRTFYYPALKKVLKWFGIKLTKQSFARGVSRVVPLVGGGIAAGITTITLQRMAKNLQRHLRKLEYARPTHGRRFRD